MDVSLNIASPSKRVAAGLIDFLLVIGITLLLSQVIISNLSPQTLNFDSFSIEEIRWVLTITFALCSALYNFGAVTIFGNTLGKKLLDIKIVTLENTKPASLNLVIREIIVKPISGLLYNLGYLSIFFNAQAQGLHDKLARTVVVSISPKNRYKQSILTNNIAAIFFLLVSTIPSILNLLYLPAAVIGREQIITYSLVKAYRLTRSSRTMMPVYNPGEFILVDLLTPKIVGFKRKDIVLFRSDFERQKVFIGRIVGLPNEQILIQSGYLKINGVTFEEEYLNNLQTDGGEWIQDGVLTTIPDESYVILGDRRDIANDSRNKMGFIQKKDIIGKVLTCYSGCQR